MIGTNNFSRGNITSSDHKVFPCIFPNVSVRIKFYHLQYIPNYMKLPYLRTNNHFYLQRVSLLHRSIRNYTCNFEPNFFVSLLLIPWTHLFQTPFYFRTHLRHDYVVSRCKIIYVNERSLWTLMIILQQYKNCYNIII